MTFNLDPIVKKRGNIFYIICLLCLFIGGSLSSCKSHKKANNDNGPYVGETIKHKNKKKETRTHTLGHKIAEESKTWLGTPYGYGRSEKGVATDCSGLVIVVYEEIAKVKLPRNSAQQADFCDDLRERDIKPGDLVFFATGKDKHKVSHVGVMLDGCKFVHASTSKGVIISEMTTPYYQRTFIKYGRVPNLRLD